jgi:uncharacterized protein YciI
MSLFIVILEYTAPLAEIDKALEAHRAWVRQGYCDGVFLVSGPQTPRKGGAILAHNIDRAALEARLALDPFQQAGLVTHHITEMAPRFADPRLNFLVET